MNELAVSHTLIVTLTIILSHHVTTTTFRF